MLCGNEHNLSRRLRFPTGARRWRRFATPHCRNNEAVDFAGVLSRRDCSELPEPLRRLWLPHQRAELLPPLLLAGEDSPRSLRRWRSLMASQFVRDGYAGPGVPRTNYLFCLDGQIEGETLDYWKLRQRRPNLPPQFLFAGSGFCRERYDRTSAVCLPKRAQRLPQLVAG